MQEPIAPVKPAPGIPQLLLLYAAYEHQLRMHTLYTSSPASSEVAAVSTNVRPTVSFRAPPDGRPCGAFSLRGTLAQGYPSERLVGAASLLQLELAAVHLLEEARRAQHDLYVGGVDDHLVPA